MPERTDNVPQPSRDHTGRRRHLARLAALLDDARKGGYAVGGFDFCNAETAQAIVEQGVALRSPALLSTGPWEIPLLGAEMLAAIADALAARADVPVCLHLDHSTDVALIEECVEAGFCSVMIDASRHDFEENVRVTASVVEMAHARGVDVEAELGALGRVDDIAVEGGGATSLTDPDLAAEFVRRTGVDALAVAIGNAHGVYAQRPALDFDRLRAIRAATDVALVLHGGSGTPPDQLHQAIGIGIVKVNVASELSRGYLGALAQASAGADARRWYAAALADGKAAFGGIVAGWMRVLDSAGRAP
jgi:tagatose 1,6-diphosphate aldolase GatY/KbaY